MADSAPQSMVGALQAAVLQVLLNDTGVKALVQARSFDEAPSDKDKPTPPFDYLGPINLQRPPELGSCSGPVRRATFRIFAVSTAFGRPEAWAVIEAIMLALDNKEISLTAPYSAIGEVVKMIAAGDVIAPLSPKSTFADFTVTLTIL